MDPEENIRQQLSLAEKILENDSPYQEDHEFSDGVELAEHVQALHGWISSGGFLPSAWAPKQPAWTTWEAVVALLCGQVMGVVQTLQALEEGEGGQRGFPHRKTVVRLLRDGVEGMARARWAYEGSPPLEVTQMGDDAVFSTGEGKTLRVPLAVFSARDGVIAEQIEPIARFLADLLGPLK